MIFCPFFFFFSLVRIGIMLYFTSFSTYFLFMVDFFYPKIISDYFIFHRLVISWFDLLLVCCLDLN